MLQVAMAGMDGTDVASRLGKALEHVDNALRVFEPKTMPYDYDTASDLKKQIEAMRAEL